jgi:signal transduction histidine kinase
MELGADDYLTKPIKTETLLKCIRTRLDKKEQQRRQSESQLVTLRNNIARSIPHELNTPLNGIMGLAQLLGTVPDAEVQEWSGEILSSAMRLHTTINKFLVYTELELAIHVPQNSVFFTQVREVDISCLAIQVADGIANRCERTDDLQLDLQPSQIVISPFLGEKLLAELIDNAFKFSKPGTPVQVSSDGDQEEISLIVRDQGRGMNPAQIAQIGAYTQFERRIYEQQGLGLGLVIAKYTVELLGGSLTIYSPSMAGTTVEVKLPRQLRC